MREYILEHVRIIYHVYSLPRANSAKRRSGRKPGAGVTNSARRFTPGKMRTQRSAKFINDCGRVTLVHGWTTSLISKCGGSSGVERAKIQKNIYRKITQHEEKFFQLSLKGMIRFDF